jgi:hypothetical protein
MAIRWFEGGWQRDYSLRGFRYTLPGEYDDSVSIPWASSGTFISDEQARQLIPILEEQGLLRPRLDERLRVEDLKITHRLIDLLEKQ